MPARSLPLPALLLAFALALASLAPAARADDPATGASPADARVTPAGERTVRATEASLQAEEILEILKGGAEPSDPGLMAHLRRVAESLAHRQWTPPRVTVQVVVTDTAGR